MAVVNKVPETLAIHKQATAADATKWIEANGEWVKMIIEKHRAYLEEEGVPAYQAAYDGYLEKIDLREKSRGDDVNHKLQANYAQLIIDTVVDYMVGKPIVWEFYDQEGDGEAKAPDALMQEYRKEMLALIRTEEGQRVLAEQLRQGSIGGYSPIICWVDEEGNIDYDEFPIQEVIPIYDARGRLKMVIRYFLQTDVEGGQEVSRTKVEVYDSRYVSYFIGDETGLSYNLDEEESPNPYQHKAGRIPVSIFINGQAARHEKRQHKAGVSDLGNGVLSLLEEYASALSDKANTVDRLLDQYLKLINVDVDEGEVLKMRKARAIALKNKDSQAGYIAPDQDDQAVENYLTRLKETFHEVTFTPKLADLSGATATEIKLKYAQLDIKAGKKEIYFMAAIKNLIAILTDLLNAKRLLEAKVEEETVYEILRGEAKPPGSVQLYSADWVVPTINRNLPQNFLEIAQIVGQLAGIVPDEYLYPLLWFIEDPKEALDAMKKQKKEELESNPLFNSAGNEFNSTGNEGEE